MTIFSKRTSGVSNTYECNEYKLFFDTYWEILKVHEMCKSLVQQSKQYRLRQ